MTYWGGETINIGDFCWHAERRRVARVAEIVEAPEGEERLGVSEAGVFLCENLFTEIPEMDLFIAQRFFEEEEISSLTGEELRLVSHLGQLAEKKAKSRFEHPVTYRVECLGNPLEITSPRSREWTVHLYDLQNTSGITYVVNENFSELKQVYPPSPL